jgi:hypothetical protein
MAIDPSIALGIRPIEQPNVINQMGQMMQLRQMQQENEGNNALNAAYQNAYTNGQYDPAAVERNLATGSAARMIPKVRQQEAALAKAQAEVKKLGYDNTQSAFSERRLALTQIDPTSPNAGPQLIAWHQANHTDPVIGPILKASGIDANTSLADIQNAIAKGPAAIQDAIRRYSMGQATYQEKLLAGEQSARNASISAAPGNRQATLAEKKYADELANPVLSRVEGENGIYLYNPRNPNSAVPLGMAGSAPPPVAQPAAVSNMLITPGVTKPSINALNQPAPVQAGPTVAAAAELQQQQNLLRPKVPIRQPVPVIKNDQVVLVPPQEAVGMTPATPGAEKALEKKVIAKEGKEAVNGVLNTLYSEYNNLVKSGGITDTRKSVEDNISARTGASAVGQLTGSFTGSESQSFRDAIEQTRPLLLTSIMKATGLSATQLNSNVELQTYLKTATDPKVSIQSNVKALNNISQMFGIGAKFEVPDIKSTKETKAADAPPQGLAPEVSKLWQYMTPEERKLWQK